MKPLFLILSLLISCDISAQYMPDTNYTDNIQSIQLTQAGKPLTYPIVPLGELNKLRLDFDDMDANIKSYHYTLELCNADWQKSILFPQDYLKGFLQKKITDYQPSTVAKTRYIHYRVHLPEADCKPVRSGNYILKVFLNGDTAKVAFTRRILITENIAAINASVAMPYNGQKIHAYQKVNFTVNTSLLNISSPQTQLKVTVLQNYRWDNARINLLPAFIRNKMYEYSSETELVFQSGREYRWIDITNFRLKTDRVQSIDDTENIFKINLYPEKSNAPMPYLRYDDYNGAWTARTTDALKTNPQTEGDYAWVNFSFSPENMDAGKEVFIAGRFTNYALNDNNRLVYNSDKKMFEKTLLLKEGYYTYFYAIKDAQNHTDLSQTEGNHFETENNYTILVYYRALPDVADRLVGIGEVNSISLH